MEQPIVILQQHLQPTQPVQLALHKITQYPVLVQQMQEQPLQEFLEVGRTITCFVVEIPLYLSEMEMKPILMM